MSLILCIKFILDSKHNPSKEFLLVENSINLNNNQKNNVKYLM